MAAYTMFSTQDGLLIGIAMYVACGEHHVDHETSTPDSPSQQLRCFEPELQTLERQCGIQSKPPSSPLILLSLTMCHCSR